MSFIFGFSLIYLTGILTGIFFVLAFLGCQFGCCRNGSGKVSIFICGNHKIFVRLAFILFLIHASLALLARFGVGI